MKIAVCFSGQLRSWRECSESLALFFDEIKNEPRFNGEVEIDFFVHTWDVETLPPHVWHTPKVDPYRAMNHRIPVVEGEIADMLTFLSPKKYVIDNLTVNDTRLDFLNNESKKYGNEISVLGWTGPHLYGVMRSGQLKLDYEIENNFQYDVCMKLRFDMRINTWDKRQIIENITLPLKDKTIYSIHSYNLDKFPFDNIGDIFYMSDSDTYNILSTFYNWLPILNFNLFDWSLTVENIISYYIRMFRISNVRLPIDPEIVRLNYDIKKLI